MAKISDLLSMKNAINTSSKDTMTIVDKSKRDAAIMEKQHLMLDAFSEIASVCNANNIKLFLQGGTLLGKVRHNGFIPWDDDMDLALYREDYDRFIAIFDSTELSRTYDLRGPGCTNGSMTRFVQVYRKEDISNNKVNKNAVWIDIFPIDDVPDFFLGRLFKGLIVNALEFIAGSIEFVDGCSDDIKARLLQSAKGKMNYCIRKIVASIFGAIPVQKQYVTIDRSIRYQKQGKYVTSATGRWHYFGEMQKRSTFFPLQETEFCGIQCWIINHPEEYLLHNYGADYMVVPEEKSREQHFS